MNLDEPTSVWNNEKIELKIKKLITTIKQQNGFHVIKQVDIGLQGKMANSYHKFEFKNGKFIEATAQYLLLN